MAKEVYTSVREALGAMNRNVIVGDRCLVLSAQDRNAFRDVEKLDLHNVPDSALIYFTGAANIAASYFLQIVDTSDGRKARMWKHTYAPHLESSIDGVKITLPPTTQWFDVYEIIRIREPRKRENAELTSSSPQNQS